jgi:hypothetical protein
LHVSSKGKHRGSGDRSSKGEKCPSIHAPNGSAKIPRMTSRSACASTTRGK